MEKVIEALQTVRVFLLPPCPHQKLIVSSDNGFERRSSMHF
jgi:hypothetical protein